MPRLPIVSPNPLIWSREGPIARNPPQHLVRFLSRASLYKFFYFRILPSMFLKTMYFTVEPCLQRVQNRKLAPNTPWGGAGGGLAGKDRMGSQCRHLIPGLLIRQLRTSHWVPLHVLLGKSCGQCRHTHRLRQLIFATGGSTWENVTVTCHDKREPSRIRRRRP